MTRLSKTALGFAAVLFVSLGTLVPGAQAGSVTYSGTFTTSPYLTASPYAYPAQVIPQFNLGGQCLTSVCAQAQAHAFGFLSFENFQPAPATVTSAFAAQVVILRPDLTPLFTLVPSVPFVDAVTAYDGVADYAGTSGVTHNVPGVAASGSTCLTAPADLALYTGAGTVVVPCSANDASFQTGASGWSFGVQVAVTYSITYNYLDCSVAAEPTTWGSIKSLYR